MTSVVSKRGRSAPPLLRRIRRFALLSLSAAFLFAASSFVQAETSELQLEPFEEKAFTAAQKSGSPFVLYFEADWCVPCTEMHAKTLRAPAVLEAAAGVRFFRVDMTEPDRYVELLKESFRVIGAPTTIFFGRDGKESERRFGYIPPEDYARMLGTSRKPAPGT
jgi:thiol:disulfide interchange protein DsbD